MIAVELRGVRKARGRNRPVQALRDVSLTVDPGEFVLIEGPSGAGKTTLLAVAAGLLRPDVGAVVLRGTDLASLGPEAGRRYRARTVGFIFQRSNLLDGLTARQNILLMAGLAGMSRKAAEEETERLLRMLDIEPLADRSPGTLSGGEEQRVAVARALVHRPAVVLADEPTGSLDGVSGQAVAESLRALAGAQGAAVITATHDARLRPFATRRMRMEDGCLLDHAE
jgi:putative ABC transport system ATP-binding protein